MKNILLMVLLLMPTLCEAKLVKKDYDYTVDQKKYEGYLVYNDANKQAPGIVMIPDWMGVIKKAKERADKTAELGYVVFVADVYGKGVRPKNGDEAAKLATSLKNDRRELRLRAQGAFDLLKKLPMVKKQKLAALGYCFGGTTALELGRNGAPLKGILTFHAGLDSPNPADGKNITGRVLVLHGADDPYNSSEDLTAFEAEMRNAHLDWELVKYGGAVHSFTDKTAGNDNSKGAAYNARADQRSWQEMRRFLAEIFK